MLYFILCLAVVCFIWTLIYYPLPAVDEVEVEVEVSEHQALFERYVDALFVFLGKSDKEFTTARHQLVNLIEYHIEHRLVGDNDFRRSMGACLTDMAHRNELKWDSHSMLKKAIESIVADPRKPQVN